MSPALTKAKCTGKYQPQRNFIAWKALAPRRCSALNQIIGRDRTACNVDLDRNVFLPGLIAGFRE